MKELTVIELSEQTDYQDHKFTNLNKKHNFINLNKKINYEYVLPIITDKLNQESKKSEMKKYWPILNMLILQSCSQRNQI